MRCAVPASDAAIRSLEPAFLAHPDLHRPSIDSTADAQMDSSSEFALRAREDEKVASSNVSKSAQKAKEKEDLIDPTASIRRKLREGMGSSSTSSGSSSAGGGSSNSSSHTYHPSDANPQFRIYEFWLMVRDTKLLTKHFTAKKLERIFEYVWLRDLKSSLQASGHIDSTHPFETFVKDRSKAEIDCRQFVEVLIRIAHQRMTTPKEREELLSELEMDRERENERRYREGIELPAGEMSDVARQMDALTRPSISIGQTTTNKSGSGVPSAIVNTMGNSTFEWGTPLFSTTRPGWALRLFGLLRCRLIPHAARLNVDTFRSQYKRIEVSTLYKKHGTILRKLFFRYAKLHSVRGRSNTTDDTNTTTTPAGSSSSSGSSSNDDAHASDAVWTNTIDYKEFIALLRDSKILDGRYLTLQQVYSIMANVQADLAKVTLPASSASHHDKDTKNLSSMKRSSMPKKVDTQTTSVAIHDGSTSSDPPPPPPAAASHARNDSVWGSGTFVGSEVNTLADLNLEHQAALTAIVPTDEQILAASATSNTELIFPEFLEALAAIASCRHPNPYKPLAIRLQHFLERDLLPWVTLLFATKE